ncbi:hypothetical protein D3C72_2227410 [compost metagenome]
MIDYPKSGLLDETVSRQPRYMSVCMKRVNEPDILIISPQTFLFGLGKDMVVTSIKKNRPHPFAVEANGAVVETYEAYRQT